MLVGEGSFCLFCSWTTTIPPLREGCLGESVGGEVGQQLVCGWPKRFEGCPLVLLANSSVFFLVRRRSIQVGFIHLRSLSPPSSGRPCVLSALVTQMYLSLLRSPLPAWLLKCFDDQPICIPGCFLTDRWSGGRSATCRISLPRQEPPLPASSFSTRCRTYHDHVTTGPCCAGCANVLVGCLGPTLSSLWACLGEEEQSF